MEGVFIRLAPDEAKDVWDALTELGYTNDSIGMKKFLIDNLFETGEKPGNSLEEFIAQHPETIERAGAVLFNGVRKAINRFKKTA